MADSSSLLFEMVDANSAELNLFGFSLASQGGIKKKKSKVEKDPPESFVGPSRDDGSAIVIATGAHQVAYHDLGDYYAYSDISRIMKYREISTYPEIDQAIEEIVNELIVMDDEFQSVEISLDDVEGISDKVKKSIEEEFNNILSLLSFNTNGYDIAKKWYIDGRLVYHIILNESKTEIIELRPIDPINIKKIKEVEEIIDPITRVKTYKTKSEYFVFSDSISTGSTGGMGSLNSSTSFSSSSVNDGSNGLKISKDAIVYVPSGLLDDARKNTISYLHSSIKTANQLRMLEDSMVIYRLVRAPERRVFKIDVGGLPAKKAELYIQNIIAKYRNKIAYDVSSGELVDTRQHLAMIEDFWLPVRENRGTEIDTLSGGDSFQNMDDLLYFQKKLFRALRVPLSRLEQESQFSLGRSSEITRDEIKFSKFISRLRAKFSDLFYQLLKTQLVLKNIITIDEWNDIKEKIFVNFLRDNYFTEFKEAEVLKERLTTLTEVDPYIGRYFSVEWVQRNVLRQTDLEIDEIRKQIEKEKKAQEGEMDNSQEEEQPSDNPDEF